MAVQGNTTLDEIEADIWSVLARATHDRHSGFRWVSLASVSENGGPQVRTLVLRRVCKATQQFTMFTDSRSQKVAELTANSAASLLFFDRKSMVQIRASGDATVDQASDRWREERSSLSEASLSDYRSVQSPGTPIAVPNQAATEDKSIDLTDLGLHFAMIVFQVRTIDWLSLSRTGHRRAVFRYIDDARTAGWLTP
ncbi:MAG: pyridoxamine 5'-phosphate oxidase family protein [Pseudomonadota bacterium]